MAASTAAAVAKGLSIGTKCVPSMVVMRPLVTRLVNSMPANFISRECLAAIKLTGHFRGCALMSRSRLCGTVL
jgi:hypothetical protein